MKTSSIIAYLVPPLKPQSTPIFFFMSPLRGIRSNGQESTNPVNTYSLQMTTPCLPLLFSFSKNASIQSIKDHVSDVIMVARDHRFSSNLSDKHPSSQYNSPHSTIPINVYYLMNNIFFDETIKGFPGEEISNDNAEVVDEVVDESLTELPRFYATDLKTLSAVIPSIQQLTDLTTGSTPSSEAAEEPKEPKEPKKSKESDIDVCWSTVDTSIDYRVLLLCTNIMNCPKVRLSFSFNHIQNREEVCSKYTIHTLCEPVLVNYREEDELKPSPVTYGKKKYSSKAMPAENKPSSQLSLNDCMELKKTTTVVLTGTR